MAGTNAPACRSSPSGPLSVTASVQDDAAQVFCGRSCGAGTVWNVFERFDRQLTPVIKAGERGENVLEAIAALAWCPAVAVIEVHVADVPGRQPPFKCGHGTLRFGEARGPAVKHRRQPRAADLVSYGRSFGHAVYERRFLRGQGLYQVSDAVLRRMFSGERERFHRAQAAALRIG